MLFGGSLDNLKPKKGDVILSSWIKVGTARHERFRVTWVYEDLSCEFSCNFLVQCNLVLGVGGGRGGVSLEFLVRVYHLVLQILTVFETKKCHSSQPFSELPPNAYPFYLDLALVVISLIRTQKNTCLQTEKANPPSPEYNNSCWHVKVIRFSQDKTYLDIVDEGVRGFQTFLKI